MTLDLDICTEYSTEDIRNMLSASGDTAIVVKINAEPKPFRFNRCFESDAEIANHIIDIFGSTRIEFDHEWRKAFPEPTAEELERMLDEEAERYCEETENAGELEDATLHHYYTA
jgi:hypothetical protein